MKKLYLIDSLYSSSNGHNDDVLHRFLHKALELNYDLIYTITSTKVSHDFSRVDNHAHHLPGFYSWLDKEINWSFSEIMDRLSWDLVSKYQSKRFWIRFFLQEDIQDSDTIILPSSDAMNLRGLILASIKTGRKPKIHAQMMNILDRVGCLKTFNDKSTLLWLRKNYSRANVTFWAETPKYRDELSDFFPTKLSLLSVPKTLQVPQIHPFGFIGFIGSARLDKGFLKIPQIVAYLDSQIENLRYLVQLSPTSLGLEYEKVVSALELCPNVTLIDSYLSISELRDRVSSLSLLFLPYPSEVYARRGSSMLTEAVACRIPLVAPSDIGISEIISEFNLGGTYDDFSHIAEVVNKVLNTPTSHFNFNEYLEKSEKFLEEMLGSP